MKPAVSALLWPGCLPTIFCPSFSPLLTELQARWPFGCSANSCARSDPRVFALAIPSVGKAFPQPSTWSFVGIIQVSAQIFPPPWGLPDSPLHSRFMFLLVLITEMHLLFTCLLCGRVSHFSLSQKGSLRTLRPCSSWSLLCPQDENNAQRGVRTGQYLLNERVF